MKFSINTIQSNIHESLPTPVELERIFTFHLCEVEGLDEAPDGDWLIDLNILPNRAHDMLGHYGVARELAGQLGLTLKPLVQNSEFPSAGYASRSISDADAMHGGVSAVDSGSVSVSIVTDKCRRYMSRRIDNVVIEGSPEKTMALLSKLGQRSINTIVDATNEVMWITGQPTHVFDADKITGGITVRMARVNESITLLDGKEIVLDESVIVIADEVAVLAIAGIKGGKHAEVDVNTKNIILEVANFDASTIRKTAQRLGLRTDASYRFERDISPSVCDEAMVLLTRLVCRDDAGAIPGTITDVYPAPQIPSIIDFSIRDIELVSGSQITNADVTNILQRYGFPYIERDGNFSVTVPLYRLDLVGRHDIIEEIIRVRGLEVIDPIVPPVLPIEDNNLEQLITYIRKHLLSLGYNEIMTYSFRDSGESSVLASAGDKSYLRANLHEGFSEALVRNYRNRDLLGMDSVSQFEIGTVFGSSDERVSLAIGCHATKQKGVLERLWKDASDMLYELGLTEIAINESIVYKDDYVIEFNLVRIVGLVTKRLVADVGGFVAAPGLTRFSEWSKYPYITRDIAVWVPEGVGPDVLRDMYLGAAGSLLVGEPRLVDQFTKEGRTSYAYRLVFQSFDHTLTDKEVEPIMLQVSQLVSEAGWEVR